LDTTLDDLFNVSTGDKATDDLLIWDGANWSTIATNTLEIALNDTTGTLEVGRGGTGTTTFEQYSLLYASAKDTISEIRAGGAGLVLKMVGGIPTWSTDVTSSGASGIWATSSNSLFISPSDPNYIVVIGASATTSVGNILEVDGNAQFNNTIAAQSLTLTNDLALTHGGTGASLFDPGADRLMYWNDNGSTVGWIGTSSLEIALSDTTGTLSVNRGGTGFTSITSQSIVYASSNNTLSELAVGNEGEVLAVVGGNLAWATTSAPSAHAILSVSHSDVEATSTLVRGDLLYVGASSKWNRLGLGPSGYILYSDGTDVSWSTTTAITTLGTIITGTWQADTIDIAYGGTGAETATGARENLDLDEIYDFAINSVGATGYIWQSDGDGRGQWVATSALGFINGTDTVLIGTTTSTHNGEFSTSTLRGYQAANDICAAEFAGSFFCRTYDILVSIKKLDISNWGGSAWIAEGPPGYTSNSNDCNGWTASSSIMMGAFWAFDSSGGGAGWLTNCSGEKPIACCKKQ